jgi:hypothetical protein
MTQTNVPGVETGRRAGQAPQKSNPRWVESGYGHKVTSQDELMRAISRIGTLQEGRTYVWRGIEDSRHRMASSLYRSLSEEQTGRKGTTPTVRIGENQLRARERALLREAREWGVGLELGGLATDLHLLATMQHHDVPTRLLDVTSNPMTALWFACQKAQPNDAAGALFAIDVTDLPIYPTLDADTPTYGSIQHTVRWSLRKAFKESAENSRPFLVRPVIRDSRMSAQEGLFISGWIPNQSTVAGVDDPALVAPIPPGTELLSNLFSPTERLQGRPPSLPFCVLVISNPIKRRMRAHLKGTYNRTRRVLFPDIEGMRDALLRGDLDLKLEPDELPILDD